jgi:hypothetical protein
VADLRHILTAALDEADRELAGSSRSGFRFGDIDVTIRHDGRGRIPALLPMIAPRTAPARDGAWVIDVVGSHAPPYAALLPEAERRTNPVLRSNSDLYYLWLDEAGGYATAIDRRTRRGLVWFTTPDRIASWHVARPFLHALKGIAAETPWTPVHAAAVARDGRAVLIVGQSGAGKTTIALASALSGWDYLGDDAVMLRAGPPAVAALYASSRLRLDMFDAFARVMPASLGNSDDAGEIKAELDMRLLGCCGLASAPLAAIVLPRRSGATRPRLTPVGRAETVRAIATAARQSIMGDDRAAFEKIAAAVRAVPCFAFDAGPDPLAAPEGLAALLDRGTVP